MKKLLWTLSIAIIGAGALVISNWETVQAMLRFHSGSLLLGVFMVTVMTVMAFGIADSISELRTPVQKVWFHLIWNFFWGTFAASARLSNFSARFATIGHPDVPTLVDSFDWKVEWLGWFAHTGALLIIWLAMAAVVYSIAALVFYLRDPQNPS